MKYHCIGTWPVSYRKLVIATRCIVHPFPVPGKGAAGFYCRITVPAGANGDVGRYCGITSKHCLVYMAVITTRCHHCTPWQCIVGTSAGRELTGYRLADR